MIAFLFNHGPDSQVAGARATHLFNTLKDESFRPARHYPVGQRPDELGCSRHNDSPADRKKHATEQNFKFSCLHDGETQSVATAYGLVGCLATPQVFVFDKKPQTPLQGPI